MGACSLSAGHGCRQAVVGSMVLGYETKTF